MCDLTLYLRVYTLYTKKCTCVLYIWGFIFSILLYVFLYLCIGRPEKSIQIYIRIYWVIRSACGVYVWFLWLYFWYLSFALICCISVHAYIYIEENNVFDYAIYSKGNKWKNLVQKKIALKINYARCGNTHFQYHFLYSVIDAVENIDLTCKMR